MRGSTKDSKNLPTGHQWEEVDSQGYVMECLACGAHICIYDGENWDKMLDAPCPGHPVKEANFIVEFTNFIPEMVGHETPDNMPFETFDEAWDFASKELEKAKKFLLSLPNNPGYRFYTGGCSMSIRSQAFGTCHWEIHDREEELVAETCDTEAVPQPPCF